jgi:hypothetical protein
VDRLSLALALLLAFVACTGAAILISGVRPAAEPGVLPWLVQVVGYLSGLAAGVLVPAHGGGGRSPVRAVGLLLMPALVALVLLDGLAMAADSGGADIGVGFVRLGLLVVIAAVTVRLARAVAAARRP